jgi:hypothetical protein
MRPRKGIFYARGLKSMRPRNTRNTKNTIKDDAVEYKWHEKSAPLLFAPLAAATMSFPAFMCALVVISEIVGNIALSHGGPDGGNSLASGYP